MQIIQAIQSGANPQQITMNILQERMGQTPYGTKFNAISANGKFISVNADC